MTAVDISCLCGNFNATVSLTDHVPVESFVCHRTRCRRNLGALCHSPIPIRSRPGGISMLKVYEAETKLSRYFCETCGSHIFEKSDCWKIQSGVVERIHSEQVFEALEKTAGHQSAEETLDGGLSALLTGPSTSNAAPGGYPQRIEPQVSIDTWPSTSHAGVGSDLDRLSASCDCEGVRFFLTRPDAEARKCSAPWPDLIVPYFTQSSDNPNDEKWWIKGSRWLAGTCACRSCRLALGSPIQAWAFVSKANLFAIDGSPLQYDFGTLRSFQSTPGARREFCYVCGATVFWHNEDRPGVVDVSVGLLQAKEGTLARRWLHWWTDRVSFAEQAFDKGLIKTLEAALHTLH